MGAVISQYKKRKSLQFIKSNFNKMSQRGIARKSGIGKTTINRWSSELGFKFKKHTVKETFFDKFNEKSSYILGFIFADGNVAWDTKKGYYSLTITASEKDKEHLERMRNIISSTKPLLYSDKTKSYRLIVNNKKICQRLIKLGVIPRKSLTVRFPKIPNKYLRHFIRGVIDGDGSVFYIKRKKRPYFTIRISSGSRKFLSKLISEIKKNTEINGNIQKWSDNVYLVEYSCSRGEKLAEYVYSDANIFLERKYLPYKENIVGGKQNEKRKVFL